MGNSILVIGGTGTIGRELLNILSENQVDFKAMVRSQEKAQALEDSGIKTVIGELGNWDSVNKALDGTDTVYLLTGVSPENVDHQNGLIDQAKASGIKKIVKVSAVGAQSGSPIHLADWHGRIEDHLKSSGLDYVILRPHSFMQNTMMSIPTIKEQGAIYQSMGSGKIPMIDTRDIAEASYHCLVKDEHNNNTYELTGPSAIDYSMVAESLSKHSGRNINNVQIPSEAHNEGMKAAGLPDWLADDLTFMSKHWSDSNEQPTNDFKQICGHDARSFDQFANDYSNYFK